MLKPLYCCSDYRVDSEGYLISKRGKRMHPSVNTRGYLVTTVMVEGKRVTLPIHRAVAKTFLGDRSFEGMVVNHKDGNKQNNCVDNLEWITQRENINHAVKILGINIGEKHGRAKAICGYDKKTGELKYSFPSIIDAARTFAPNCQNKKVRGIQNCIWRVLTGSRKSYMGCIWKYA